MNNAGPKTMQLSIILLPNTKDQSLVYSLPHNSSSSRVKENLSRVRLNSGCGFQTCNGSVSFLKCGRKCLVVIVFSATQPTGRRLPSIKIPNTGIEAIKLIPQHCKKNNSLSFHGDCFLTGC